MVKVVAPCIQMSSVAACGLLWLQLVWQLLRHTFLVLHPLPQLDISCTGSGGQGLAGEAALLANILCFTWLGNGSLRNYVVLRMQAPPHTLVQPPSAPAPAPAPTRTTHPLLRLHCLLSLLLRSVFSILVFNMRCLKVCKVISCQPFCQPLTKCCSL